MFLLSCFRKLFLFFFLILLYLYISSSSLFALYCIFESRRTVYRMRIRYEDCANCCLCADKHVISARCTLFFVLWHYLYKQQY